MEVSVITKNNSIETLIMHINMVIISVIMLLANLSIIKYFR